MSEMAEGSLSKAQAYLEHYTLLFFGYNDTSNDWNRSLLLKLESSLQKGFNRDQN